MTSDDASREIISSIPGSRPARRYAIRGVAGLMLVASAYWVYDRFSHVNVSDARVAATMISVSTRVAGWVTDFPAEEGQRLTKGAVIAKVDTRDAILALEEARSNLAAIHAQLAQLRAEKSLAAARIETGIKAAQSQVAAANATHQANLAELTRAKAEWRRAQPLYEKQIMPREVWEKKHNIYQQAKQNADVSQAVIHTQEAALEEARVARKELAVYNSRIVAMQNQSDKARARVNRLASDLSDHTILSPIDGVVDEVFVDPAEYVNPGQRLLIMHDPNKLWVSANIKETDLRHIHLGSMTKISVDAYPGKSFSGQVVRIGNAATSQFALLPNPNPSGNFTKVTQRMEVRISLEQQQGLLKPGMMVEVEIDIANSH